MAQAVLLELLNRLAQGQAGPTLSHCCCAAGEKRRSDAAPGGSGTAKRSSSGGLVRGGGSSVRAAHLLVKHKDSRRPSSWKVRLAGGWGVGGEYCVCDQHPFKAAVQVHEGGGGSCLTPAALQLEGAAGGWQLGHRQGEGGMFDRQVTCYPV
jgi:hypothetical protein